MPDEIAPLKAEDATTAKTTTIRLPPEATFSTQPPPPQPIAQDAKLTLPPTTTEQQDLTTSGQRRINLIWELTQAAIALMVVVSNMAMSIYVGVHRIPAGEYPFVLSSGLFLVLGFYYSRTNHAAIGGVGAKPSAQVYEGR